MSETEIVSRVLYRDEHLIVLNKPQGIPVHRTPKGGEHMEQYFDALRFGAPRAPSLAHRLDKETSGCLVLGRTRDSLARLGKWFEQGKVKKYYWAIVDGVPEQDAGTINAAIARRDLGRGKWQFECVDASDENGQEAITHYRVLGKNASYTWLEMSPQTGRTHQLRLHAAKMGFPIIGDMFYGRGDGIKPLMLHARSIEIPQPHNPKINPQLPPTLITCPPPSAMAELLKGLGG